MLHNHIIVLAFKTLEIIVINILNALGENTNWQKINLSYACYKIPCEVVPEHELFALSENK